MIPQLEPFVGKKVINVFYGEINMPERDFDYGGFHVVDTSIHLKFEGGLWLNWNWTEENGIVLNFDKDNKEQVRALEDCVVRKGYNTPAWEALKGKLFTDFDYRTVKHKGESYLSDAILSFGELTFSVVAIDEPDPRDFPDIHQMNVNPFGWLAVVFDDALLEKYQRGQFMPVG